MGFKSLFSLLKESFRAWDEAKVPRLGAALAYYAVFSIAPMVLIAIGVAGLVFGPDAARGAVVGEIESTVGTPVAKAIESLLVDNKQSASIWATIIGFATLLFGAAGVFGQLQDSLNTVWGVAPKPGRGIRGIIRDRFLSLTMVLGTGFLLLVSLVVSAMLAAMGGVVGESLPGGAILWRIVNFTVSLLVVGFLFAMIYKFLPDARIAWRDVWIGAAITALLFALGKFLIGLYLGRASTTSGFGAAGSLVVILIWVYYASQILLFGAVFTRVFATQYGSGVKPAANAEPIAPGIQALQGIREPVLPT